MMLVLCVWQHLESTVTDEAYSGGSATTGSCFNKLVGFNQDRWESEPTLDLQCGTVVGILVTDPPFGRPKGWVGDWIKPSLA